MKGISRGIRVQHHHSEEVWQQIGIVVRTARCKLTSNPKHETEYGEGRGKEREWGGQGRRRKACESSSVLTHREWHEALKPQSSPQ